MADGDFRFLSKRNRSDGTLSHAEMAFCRSNAIPLAYDPVQMGWVSLDCFDDIDPDEHSDEEAGAGRDRYHFRPWTKSDAGTLARLLSSPKLWQYLPEPYPGILDSASAEDMIEISNTVDHHKVYAVEFDADVVGQARILFEPGNPERRIGEVSYWIGEQHWGKGIGGDLVAKFTRKCLAEIPGLQTIVAKVHRDNVASLRILESIGYRHCPHASDAEGQRVLAFYRWRHN